jgi:hypothetical protein
MSPDELTAATTSRYCHGPKTHMAHIDEGVSVALRLYHMKVYIQNIREKQSCDLGHGVISFIRVMASRRSWHLGCPTEHPRRQMVAPRNASP